MTRHPTTAELRRALTKLCASPADVERVMSAQDPGWGAKRGQTQKKWPPVPRVPIIGVDSGASPGTKPQPGCSGAYLERAERDTQKRVSSNGVRRPR